MKLNRVFLFGVVAVLTAGFFLGGCSSNKHESKAKRKKVVKYTRLKQEDKEYRKAKKFKVKDRKTFSHFYTRKGKISPRGFLVEEVKFDSVGNLTAHIFYESDGSIDRKFLYYYDDKGNQIKKESYDWRNTLRYQKISEDDKYGNEIFAKELNVKTGKYNKIFFDYDTAGNLLQKIKYSPDDEVLQKVVFQYDKNGNVVYSAYFNEQGKKYSETRFKYDSLGNKIEEMMIIPGTTPKYKHFKYDERGNLIFIDGGYFSQKFAYNKDNDEILEELFDRDGYLQQKFTTDYDDRGLMSERFRYDGQNRPALYIEYKYEFYQ